MVNISKKELSNQTAKKIRARFFKTIVDLKGNSGTQLLDELFTETEQIMLAKRLAALFLLTQGTPPYRVSRLLKLSSSTTVRLSKEIERGNHSRIADIVRKKKERDKFWAELETMIRFGMPEMGRNRWKWLDEYFSKK